MDGISVSISFRNFVHKIGAITSNEEVVILR